MNEDNDPAETDEWREALRSLVQSAGPERARFVLDALADIARDPAIGWQPRRGTPYVNTIPVDAQPAFPGDLAIEEKLASIMRWNSLAMVVRANNTHAELGGHIASYASAADLFEVGFNHFSAVRKPKAAAIWCSIRRTRRPASMRVRSSKGAWTNAIWPTTGRRSPRTVTTNRYRVCRAIRTRG